jgi:hypothetical protein
VTFFKPKKNASKGFDPGNVRGHVIIECMDKKWAIVCALIVPPILTELLTANTPLPRFILPINLLWLVLGYGIPLLVIREFAIRWRLGLWGILIIGLAYGIFNEGILAQTLVQAAHMPIGNFDGYLVGGGINIGWALYILFWHALHSVLYPFLLLTFFRNDWESWLSDRMFKFLTGFLLVGSLFVVALRMSGQMIFLELLMITLVLIAKNFHKKILLDPLAGTWKTTLLGFCSILYALALFTESTNKISYLIYILTALIIPCVAYIYISKRRFLSHKWLLLFGLGSYIAYAMLAMFSGNGIVIVTNVILIGFLAWATVKVSKGLSSSALQL